MTPCPSPSVAVPQAREVRRKLVEHNPYAEAISRESVATSRLAALSKKNTKSGTMGTTKGGVDTNVATNRQKNSRNNNKDAVATASTTTTTTAAAAAALNATSMRTVGPSEFDDYDLGAAGGELDATLAAVRW